MSGQPGGFDRAAWEAAMEAWAAGVDLSPYVADGTVIPKLYFDEPVRVDPPVVTSRNYLRRRTP